ncbi:MAG: hypothetical protein CW691_09565 [Candidatus Bathyarchaeum sp.]|nr:MAG: hypothetical protein CW691_09565 [Candidatus Bathyarchaeum sp.]
MEKLVNMPKISTIALILLLIISAIVVILPTAIAQDVESKKTYAFIGAIPNPVGVNQDVLLHVGITDYLESAEDGFEGLTVTVERPDGETETLGPIRTDSTGGTGWVFRPTMTGTYYLKTHFPEQTYTWKGLSFFAGLVGPILYEASESDVLELVVQEDPITYYPGHSLPTEYWDRPIDSQLREWWQISASWVRDPDNFYTPYNDGPETAHILWAKEIATGGLAGGELFEYSYGMGDAYEGKWPSRFILAGKLYYTSGGARPDLPIVTHCVDLSTGEELWNKIFMNNQSISFGQILYWDSYNYHGAYAYLYVAEGGMSFFGPPQPAKWTAFDAYTGDWCFTIDNVPAGTTLYGPNNEMYVLSVDTMNNRMTLWDMSVLGVSRATSSYDAGSWGNMAHGKTFDGYEDPNAFTVNVTIPAGLAGSVQVAAYGDRVIGGSITNEQVSLWGLSLEEGNEGDLLFENTWDAPADWAAGNVSVSMSAASLEDKVLVIWTQQTRKFYGFSLETGEYLWGIDESEDYLNVYYSTTTSIAYGKLFSTGACGIVYCYDVTDGDLLWTYNADDYYSEILWANNWWINTLFITDGKIYIGHEEHSPIDPRPRGAPFFCLDVETGNLVFRIDGAFRQTHWGGNAIIGDSIIATMNTYDQRIYAIGKGPSETTMIASPKIVNYGSSVMIEGTVMDISAGTDESRLTARFPNGVPAVSDASMSEWMKYVYMQFERPAQVTGVEVRLEAVDPNGGYVYIDTVTSDGSGMFKKMWKPEMEGEYTIIATFTGSNGYYGSYAETSLGVAPALTTSTPIDTDKPLDTTEPATEPWFITTELAIIVVVAVAAVIGVAAYWILKRK